MKKQLQEEFEKIESELQEMSRELFENPELGGEEYKSSQLLIDFLEKHEFIVEKGVVDRPTAFRAVYDSNKEGKAIGFMSEYDALPGVGHGCGHNLIATMGVGAGVVLSKVLDKTGGKVIVYGTPAEETNGAKVPMSDAQFFDELDAAMMVHPEGESSMSGESLAMDAIQYSYHGKTAHAAAAPEQGINALDSVIQLFNGINALREHLRSDVRIHGVINEGGTAANVVPDYASAQFYIRAKDRAYLDEVASKVQSIAEGAALMTGAQLSIENYELSYDDMRTNEPLSEAFRSNLEALGEETILPAKKSLGSIDMGNVSQAAPAIHPYIGMNMPGVVAHTTTFANQTMTKSGMDALRKGGLSLAMTGYDVLTNADLSREIKRAFEETKK